MARSFLDHITVTAFSLEAGGAWVQDSLGVELQVGGEHPRMATHNLLLSLGDTLYLEVIAPNPAAPLPVRPRWFGLDSLTAQSAPALSTWVVRTSDIHNTSAASSEALGNVEPMSRDTLNWLISIPGDGVVPLSGVAPALIQWQTDPHPAGKLEERGLSLIQLEVYHPQPERILHLLRSLRLDAPVSVKQAASAYLQARINTPHGMRVLSGLGYAN